MGQQANTRPSVLGLVPSGAPGTRATLRLMAGLVRRYRTDQRVRDLALRIVAGIPGKAYPIELDFLRRWVQANIRYTRDVNSVETLQTPTATLDIKQGDCDDQATLLGALAESIGFNVRFVAMGRAAARFEHVFMEAEVPGRGWVAAETTENVPLGWRPQWHYEMVEVV